MNFSKKKIIGMSFFVLLISATFLIKNIVGATIDPAGNSITGTNINIANVASYDVTLQFNGTLDSGDIVVVELIDASLNSISGTYISTGENEATISINFDATTLGEGTITLSGSVYDSGLTLIVGAIQETVLMDTTAPAISNIASGNYFSGSITPDIVESNFSGATLSGVSYTPDTAITDEGTYELWIQDIVGNETAITFTIDTTAPSFGGFTDGGYYSGSITITFTDNATLNGTTITSGEIISAEGSHILVVTDLAGNNTGGTFTIDTMPPTITNIISGAYYTGNITPSINEENLSGATLNGTPYTSGTEINTDGIYTLNIIDLVGYETGTTFTIDKTYPSFAGVTSGSYYSGNKAITFSDTNLSGATLNGVTYTSGTEISDEGTYIFIVSDVAGNTTGATFTIDKTYPNFAGAIGGTYYSGNLSITFSDTNLSGATLNGVTYTSGTTISVDNTYTFIVMDRAGHQTGTSFILDKTRPAGISITSPTTTSYRQTATTYSITWNTGSEINFGPTPIRIEYSNNGFLGGSYTSIITTGTSNNGSILRTVDEDDTSSAQIRIIATDLAGNIGYFTGNQFKIDSTAPTSPSFVYPVGGEFLKGGSGYIVTRTGGGDGNLSGKILERSTGGSFVTITTLGDGAFTYLWTPSSSINSNTIRLGIKYQDKGGLTSPYIQTTDFIVDSTKPTITFTDTNSNRRNYNATGTTTSGDTLAGIRSTGVLYRTDVQFDEYCNGGSTTVPVLSTDGTGYVYACVQDKAGNVTTGVQMYKIDKTAPLVTMPADKRVNTATGIDITVNADVSGISGYVRSKVSGPGAITFTTTIAQDPTTSADTEGTYVLQVLVKDNANNTTTGTIQFIRDTTAPILTGSTASVSNSTVTFSFTGDEAGTVSYSGACGNGSLSTAISGRNTTTFSLANATYSTCKVQVTDVAGNGSSRLTIPTFTVNYSAPSGGGGGGGGGGIATCTSNQLVCTNGIYVKKSGVLCQGGNLGEACADICVDGDYSGNPNDGLCKDETKVEAHTGIIITSTGKWITYESPFNRELTNAYSYALNLKITTKATINGANMTGELIRIHLAKMISEYAMKVLKKTPNTSINCSFSDTANRGQELQGYAITACQLGLMGLKTDGTPAEKFNPGTIVNRAIFGTTLSRAMRGETYNGGKNRYTNHLKALQSGNIMNSIDKPMNTEFRGYVMLMMMRADQNIIKSTYTSFTPLRGSKTFIPYTGKVAGTTNTTPQEDAKYTAAELSFINNANKNYQFSEGYTAGISDVGVRYLQYFLKDQGYYTSTINGTNTTATMEALFHRQRDNGIITNENDPAAGYLGPATRTAINLLLKTLLNP